MNHIEKLGIKAKRFLRKLMRNLHEKTLHLRNDRDRIMAGVILNIWGGEYHMAYQISDDCISLRAFWRQQLPGERDQRG